MSDSPVKKTNVLESKIDAALLKIVLVVAAGGVMSVLDTTIVNVAINHLSVKFGSPVSTVQWVASGYMLALAMVIPLTGWASDRFGAKATYICSILIFTLASVLSGLSWSVESLIAFRVLQGFGGGMILPIGIAIATRAAGSHRVGRVMAIMGIPMLLGPILGPILGGYFVDYLSWRWIFLVNLPVGVFAIAAASVILRSEVPKASARLDWIGLLLLSPGSALLLYGLADLTSHGAANASQAFAFIGLGVGLLLGFFIYGLRRKNALIDVNLFKQQTVGASAVTNFLFGGAFFGYSFLTPLYAQIVCHRSALSAGLLAALQGIGAMITMPLGGKLTDKIGAGRVVLTGLSLCAIALLILSRLDGATSYHVVQWAIFIFGLGSGATVIPTMSAALATLKHDDVPRASSGLNVMLRFGGSIGTAIAAMLFSGQLSDILPGQDAKQNGLSAVRDAVASSPLLSAKLSVGFGNIFSVFLVITSLGFVAAYFLPRRRVETSGGNQVGQRALLD